MISKVDALEMMVEYLGAKPHDVLKNIEDTQVFYARFGFLERLYAHKLTTIEHASDDEQVM